MLIGTHISAAGGLDQAPANAAAQGCECYQFFSRSPRGGQAPALTPELLKKFKTANQKYKFKNFYIHSPYYINLASSNNKIYYGSIKVLREELERGSTLGVRAMMFHIGSARDLGPKAAIVQVVKGLKQVIKGYRGSCQPLLEISAGSGNIIGDSFEEISEIIKKTETKTTKNLLGVCFDTAHAFASGYDLRSSRAILETFKKFDKIIGLKRLKLIHANDSKAELGSHKDRHAHLGLGHIGKIGFQELIYFLQAKKINVDIILETPTDAGAIKDIKFLKKTRDKK